MNKLYFLPMLSLCLLGCSGGSDEGGAGTGSAAGGTEGKYTLCQCVNEPIRSSEKAEACAALSQTLPDYVTQVMACKGEVPPGE